VLSCQIEEMEQLHGRLLADHFLRVVVDEVGSVGASGPLGVLDQAAHRLRRRPEDWLPLTFAVQGLGIAPDQVRAGDDIFRFHVPDLRRLRRIAVGGGSATAR
jgi:hypothetical protein